MCVFCFYSTLGSGCHLTHTMYMEQLSVYSPSARSSVLASARSSVWPALGVLCWQREEMLMKWGHQRLSGPRDGSAGAGVEPGSGGKRFCVFPTTRRSWGGWAGSGTGLLGKGEAQRKSSHFSDEERRERDLEMEKIADRFVATLTAACSKKKKRKH